MNCTSCAAFLLATSASLMLGGCAPKPVSIDIAHAANRLPMPGELASYVRERWGDDYGPRFSRYARRPGKIAELLDVTDVDCVYYIATPYCAFNVTARFEDEAPKHQEMTDQFDWTDDGKLQSVIVLYHERPRR